MELFNSWFPPPKTHKQQMRENEREIRRNMMELDRERKRLIREEDPIKREMRVEAQKGNMQAARMLSKNIVSIRNGCNMLLKAKYNLQNTLIQMKKIKSSVIMADVMKSTTRMMRMMTCGMDPRSMAKMLEIFERENERMESTQEMMDDTMEGMLSGENDDEEEDKIFNQMMEEIGITTADKMENLNNKKEEEDLYKDINIRIQKLSEK